MKKIIEMIAGILVIIGALNWGLYGFFGYNLVESLFGMGSLLTMIIYDIVGVSALVLIILKVMKMPAMKKMKK